MKNKKQQGSEGYVLLGVMVIAVILSLLVVGSMSKGGQLAMAAARSRQRAQDLWFCESAMTRQMANFYGGSYGFPFTIDDSGRQVSVDIDISSGTDIGNNKTQYTVVATASSGGEDTCQISQLMTVEREAVPSVDLETLFSWGGNTNGSPFVWTEDGVAFTFSLDQNGKIQDHTDGEYSDVMVYGDASLPKNGFTIDQLNLLVSGSVDNMHADVYDNTNIVSSSEVFDLMTAKMVECEGEITAGGDDEYVVVGNDNVTVPENGVLVLKGSDGSSDVFASNVNISGTGTVIIEGDLELAQNANFHIATGIDLLVRGSLVAENSFNFNVNGDDALVYVGGHLSFKNTGNMNVKGALLVDDYMEFKNSSMSDTFVFCNGYVKVENNTHLEGVLICNQFLTGNNSELFMNDDAIPNWLKVLLENSSGSGTGSGGVIDVVCSDWQKVAL